MMLLGGGLIAVFGSDVIGFGGAGPLGCVTAAFVSCVCWTQQGWNIEDVSFLCFNYQKMKKKNSIHVNTYLFVNRTQWQLPLKYSG